MERVRTRKPSYALCAAAAAMFAGSWCVSASASPPDSLNDSGIAAAWPEVLTPILTADAGDEEVAPGCLEIGELVAFATPEGKPGHGTAEVDVSEEAAPATPPPEPSFPAQTWRAPPIVVVGHREPEFVQEQRIGTYNQPRWTAHRRFPTTRIYVRPEGEVEVEYWLRAKTGRDGETDFEHRQELEIGLGHRLQLDVYMIEKHATDSDELYFDQSLELRYALADWDELPGNPTFYFEYVFQEDRADKIEVKGLFGGELAPRWHWGVNLIWEQELGDAEETVFELTHGLSYSITDELAIGVEGKFEIANEEGDRGTWHENLRVGPSIQWSPLPQMHIDVTPLFGITSESSQTDVYLVIGWEF